MKTKKIYHVKGNQEARISYFTKGQVAQIGYFILILFFAALTILTVKYINTQFFEAVDEGGYNVSTVSEVEQKVIVGWEMSDYAFLLLTMMLFAGLIFTSYMIPTHPIFLVINVFGIFFLVFIGMLTSDLYGEIVSGDDAVFGEEAETFTIMNFIMSYLPFFVAGVIFITSIVMYMRGSSGL